MGLIYTAAYSGLRWGELAGLRRCDIDLDAGTLTVARKLSEVNGNLTFGPPKTAASKRTVGIPSFVARSLQAHLDRYADPGPYGLAFPSPDGGPMRRSNFRRRIWVPATTAAGVAGLRFHHDLRHTAATLAAASGTSVKALMARIGHASTSAALRYRYVIDGQDAEIVDYLERFGHQPGNPSVPSRAHDEPPATAPIGNVVGTPSRRVTPVHGPQTR